MAVHLLRTSVEPAEWAISVIPGAFDEEKAHLVPEWPQSTRYALIAVVRNPGKRDKAHTRALWVTTQEEMDRLLTYHSCKLLWFTVARRRIEDSMIERTLGSGEPLYEP